jgi:hypothetical protein
MSSTLTAREPAASRPPEHDGAGASKPSPAPRPKAAQLAFIPKSVLFALSPLLTLCALGWPYYSLPASERPWHAMHEWFRPSGHVGQAMGFLAFAMFSFLWLYPLRKRFRSLSFTGSLGSWLDVHIVAGVLVPLVGAIHAAWRFHGVIGLGYFAMLLVALSGFVGRYLYVRIPRTKEGLELTREDAANERRELVEKIAVATGLATEEIAALLQPTPTSRETGIVRALGQMVADDFGRRRAIARLVRDWKASRRTDASRKVELRRIVRLARREMAISQQVRMLEHTHRIFRYWHVAHKPFAITAFLAVLIHVVVVVLLGQTWIQ